MKKYSKSSDFYKNIKSGFFDENNEQLSLALKKNKVYTAQPLRVKCKLCEHPLVRAADFSKHGVKYVFCRECDHLNGLHQDTMEFAKKMYTDDDGSNYSKFYMDDKYRDRLQHIYLPKAKFLLEELGSNVSTLYDYGCGLGHLVNAFRTIGISADGGDVSEILVSHGNDAIEQDHGMRPLDFISFEESSNHIKNLKVDVLSAMAVMEHLSNLEEFMDAVRQCDFKYFYYSVPTYGLSVPVEAAFENIFPRHLSGGHTHLFTERSLKTLHKKMNVTPIAEWRFGTDIQDLKRSLEISLSQSGASDYYLNRFQNEFSEYSDALQATVDQAHNCSQIHVICKKN